MTYVWDLFVNSAAAVQLTFGDALANAINHGSVNARGTGKIRVTAHADDAALLVAVHHTVPMDLEEVQQKADAHRLEMGLTDMHRLRKAVVAFRASFCAWTEVTLRKTRNEHILKVVK